MSVNAKFVADYTQFEAATKNAVVTLKSFDTETKNVEKDLTRMTNSLSGQKVIQQATLMAEAVERLGGKSKLTEAELQRLGGQAAEAAEKMRKLGIDVPQKIDDLAKSVQGTTSALDQMKVAVTGAFQGFTLASLAVRGIDLLAAGVGEVVTAGVKLGPISKSFDQLTKGIHQSGEAMLQTTRSATKGLIADLDIMEASNKAILLGLPVTSSEMGKLSAAAVSLGRAMGQDATKSLDDLITALGRSSPMILDNLGLTVKVGEANEIYARQLGKTVNELTEAEKKTAFYNAAMTAAEQKTAQLGGVQLTVTDQLGRFWTMLKNVGTETVAAANQQSFLAAALGKVADGLERMAQARRDLAEADRRAVTSGGKDPFATPESVEAQRMAGQLGHPNLGFLSGFQGIGFGPRDSEIAKVYADSSRLMTQAVKRTTESFDDLTMAIRTFSVDMRGTTDMLGNSLMGKFTAPISSKLFHGIFNAMDPRLLMGAVPRDISGRAQGNPGSSFLGGIFGPKSGGFLSGISGGFKDILNGFTSGNGLSGLFKNLGGSIMGGVGNVLGGAFTGGISSLLNFGIQGIGKLFGGLFGAEGKKTNRARDAAISDFTGIEGDKGASQAKFREMAVAAGIANAEVDKLFSTKKTKDFESAMDSISNKIRMFTGEQEADQERLNAAIEKYGFTLEQLGPKLQKQKLDEQAKDLIEDWRVLIGSGIEITDVNNGMADAINEYLRTAIKLGQEVPNAFRPILEKMAEQGTLTDEAGNAITDLEDAGIKFSETMTEGFDKVVKKLDELIEKIGLASVQLGSMPSPPSASSIIDPGSLSNSDLIAAPGFASGTSGRYLDFGSGTPAILHGRERVMTEAEGRAQSLSMSAVVDAIGRLDSRMNAVMSTMPIALRDAVLLAR